MPGKNMIRLMRQQNRKGWQINVSTFCIQSCCAISRPAVLSALPNVNDSNVHIGKEQEHCCAKYDRFNGSLLKLILVTSPADYVALTQLVLNNGTWSSDIGLLHGNLEFLRLRWTNWNFLSFHPMGKESNFWKKSFLKMKCSQWDLNHRSLNMLSKRG